MRRNGLGRKVEHNDKRANDEDRDKGEEPRGEEELLKVADLANRLLLWTCFGVRDIYRQKAVPYH